MIYGSPKAPVDLAGVYAHLRISGDDDTNIRIYVGAAWDYVRAFTSQTWDDNDSSTVVPYAVNAAVLLLVADLYENREAQSPVALQENKTVERLLWPYRVF